LLGSPKIVLAIAVLCAVGALARTAALMPPASLPGSVHATETEGTAAQTKTATPQATVKPKEKRIEAAEEYAKKLLVLMDRDKDAKVSKQEFMSFMEAEFDRLDTKKDGKLDVKELLKLPVKPNVGK
jgi:tagatose-1,6-bisphosphate aldolase